MSIYHQIFSSIFIMPFYFSIIHFLMAFLKIFFVFESDNFSQSYDMSTCCSAWAWTSKQGANCHLPIDLTAVKNICSAHARARIDTLWRSLARPIIKSDKKCGKFNLDIAPIDSIINSLTLWTLITDFSTKHEKLYAQLDGLHELLEPNEEPVEEPEEEPEEVVEEPEPVSNVQKCPHCTFES